jgi:hypothetical protein
LFSFFSPFLYSSFPLLTGCFLKLFFPYFLILPLLFFISYFKSFPPPIFPQFVLLKNIYSSILSYTYDLTITPLRTQVGGCLTTKKHRSGRLFLLTFFTFCYFFYCL